MITITINRCHWLPAWVTASRSLAEALYRYD